MASVPGLGAEPFRAIAELGGAVAWVIDCATGLPSYISPSIETLLGYGLADFEHQFGTPDAAGPLAALCGGLRARLARLAAGDLSRLRLVRQFDQPHRDGRTVPIEVVSSVLADHSGNPTQLVGIVRDRSARREHELEQERAQRRFTSMLNHEFRTPLSTIDGAIQRLEVTGANADQPTRERYRRIGAAVERLIGMLDDHLSPDRVAQAGVTRPADSIDPRQLLEQGAQLARAAGREVSCSIGALPAALRCAPDGLRLALKVLVDNALRYSPPGTPIALAGRLAEGGIELLVRDYGDGVPPAELDRIFAKAYRGANAGHCAGSGLGLYMARSVVEVHGGTVEARNLAPGAEFRIWLPARMV
jgi:signal transduction histidine kinase